MLEVSFDLRRGVIRPIIVDRYNDISILIDTGAVNSVWTRGKNNFARYFPNYSIDNPHSSISGFGGNADGMTCVADFRLGNEIYYPEFKVVVSLMLSMPADLILGASALSGIDYTISDVDKKIKFVMRNNNRARRIAEISNGEYNILASEDEAADTAGAFNKLYNKCR